MNLLGRDYVIYGVPSDEWFGLFVKDRQWDEQDFDLLGALIKPGDVVIDVGSNIGLFSLTAASLGASVRAIEADIANYGAFCKTIEANGLDGKILACNYVVGDGSAVQFVVDEKCRSSSHCIPGGGRSESRKLDDLFPDMAKVDFIKIDVEGAEADVLRGARQIIQKHDPIIMLEFNTYALLIYRNTSPLNFLRQLVTEFPQVFAIANKSQRERQKISGLIPIRTPNDAMEFLHINLFNGLVHDLLCLPARFTIGSGLPSVEVPKSL